MLRITFPDVANERKVEGDLILGDMGDGVPFRAGCFDGAISISALQWLCNADKKYHKPGKRLFKFFTSLYASLSRGARAVFQFYPENSAQMELITSQAMKAGFTGGVLVDYPNSTKAKKFFLGSHDRRGAADAESFRNRGRRISSATRHQERRQRNRTPSRKRQEAPEEKQRLDFGKERTPPSERSQC